MNLLPEKINKSILLSLPHRKWDNVSEYDFLYLVPTNKKHDSGYSIIAIVGCNNIQNKVEAEIAATCDDIGWTFPKSHPYEQIEASKLKMILRTDCLYPSGILRMWASSEHYFKGKFRVGVNVSSTDIELFLVSTGISNQITGKMFQ